MKKIVITMIMISVLALSSFAQQDMLDVVEYQPINKAQINIINLMVLGDFNIAYEKSISNTLSTISILHYIPQSELDKQSQYNYPNLSFNFGLRSYIKSHFLSVFAGSDSTGAGSGAYIELLGGINKADNKYFGSGILWLGVSQSINDHLFVDYGVGISRYLGDSDLYDDVSNAKDVIPGVKFSLGIKL